MYQTINVRYTDGVFIPYKTNVKLKPNIEAVVVVSVPGVERTQTKAERIAAVKMLVSQLQQRNPFKSIGDPVAWQKKVRADRELPGRQ